MRRGLTVSLIGIDGAGKSTVARAVADATPGARVVYTGLWQRPRPAQRPRVPGSDLALRLWLIWRAAAIAAYYRAWGRVVLLDRSPQEALLGMRPGQAWRDRLYFAILARSAPAPDLTILLDVDGATAFERKGEHDPSRLEEAREEYLRLAARMPHSLVLDARQPLGDVREAVLEEIAATRIRGDGSPWPPLPQPRRDAKRAGGRRGLRILIVTPGVSQPPSDGFSIRVDGLVRQLARRHRVTLLRFDGPDGPLAVRRLGSIGVDVQLVRRSSRTLGLWKWLSIVTPRSYRSRYYHDPAMQRAIDRALASGEIDIVQLESTELCSYDLGPITRPPVVLDTHNVHGELLRRIAAERSSLAARLYWRLEAAKFEREERACWRAVDACVMTSERETAMVAATDGVRRVITVPNAVDIASFRPVDVPVSDGPSRDGAPPEIVFTGLLSYRPNEDAVAWFVRDVLPRILRERPDAKLTVVGKEVPAALAALAGPHVSFTGYVPDVRPYLARAAVVIVPLRAGSGTRLKILEALAMGRAIVSTTLGAEGLGVVPGRDLVLADQPQAFADAVVRLLGDAALREQLGSAGRRLVERDHGWEAATATLEHLYEELVPRRLGAPAPRRPRVLKPSDARRPATTAPRPVRPKAA